MRTDHDLVSKMLEADNDYRNHRHNDYKDDHKDNSNSYFKPYDFDDEFNSEAVAKIIKHLRKGKKKKANRVYVTLGYKDKFVFELYRRIGSRLYYSDLYKEVMPTVQDLLPRNCKMNEDEKIVMCINMKLEDYVDNKVGPLRIHDVVSSVDWRD